MMGVQNLTERRIRHIVIGGSGRPHPLRHRRVALRPCLWERPLERPVRAFQADLEPPGSVPCHGLVGCREQKQGDSSACTPTSAWGAKRFDPFVGLLRKRCPMVLTGSALRMDVSGNAWRRTAQSMGLLQRLRRRRGEQQFDLLALKQPKPASADGQPQPHA